MLLKEEQPKMYKKMLQTMCSKYGSISKQNRAEHWEKQLINQIVAQSVSSNYIKYKDYLYYDEVQELLKREYSIKQIGRKIQSLSEYYKFHRNLPFWNNRSVQKIMGKYYNKVKDVDYKRIKSLLKRQQNISLTTQKSFSSLDDSNQNTKKSHYSSVLSQLDHSSETVFLKDVCQKIKLATESIQVQGNFRGKYCSGQQKFEQFLKNQKKMEQIGETQLMKKNDKLKVIKLNSKKTGDQKILSKKLNFNEKNLTKSIQLFQKSSKQLQKDDFNRKNRKISIIRQSQALIRQSMSDRQSVSKTKTLTKEVSPKNTNREKMVRINSQKQVLAKSKSLSGNDTINLGKTLRKIRKQNQKQRAQTKVSLQKSLNNLKSRSNSNRSFKSTSANKVYENILRKKSSQKQKLFQSAQRGSIPLSTIKGSIIELAQIKNNTNKVKNDQSLNKHLKNNSNLTINKKDQQTEKKATLKQNDSVLDVHKHEKSRSSYGLKESKNLWNTDKVFGKKRSSMVQNMVQKKLQTFKKKLAL